MIRLGSSNDTLCQDVPLSWPSDNILYLGITIPLDGQNNVYELNLSLKLEETKQITLRLDLKEPNFIWQNINSQNAGNPQINILIQHITKCPRGFLFEPANKCFWFLVE